MYCRYAELTGRPQVMVSTYDECAQAFLSAKVLILTNDPEALLAAARAEFSHETVNCFPGSPHPYFVEFLRAGASKGDGLRRVCQSLGVPLEDTCAFGDGENDKVHYVAELPLLRVLHL